MKFFLFLLSMYSLSSLAGIVKTEASGEITKNERAYRKKYINLNGDYAKGEIFSAATWSLNGRDTVLLFLQFHGQCRVVEFSTPERNATNGILLDSPWCKYKSNPIVEERGDESIIKYAVRIKSDTSAEEIRLNNKTGDICSNSFGNTEMQCE
ncbi:hypothetical protein [Aquitalea magnusonii]|uniref:hypothetical protein n=1 Tax=Aquitalea magnusonii TaxID=332411 RepID=UPI000B5C2989|nr:hypothetical protein [Aquitalea magnusonii]